MSSRRFGLSRFVRRPFAAGVLALGLGAATGCTAAVDAHRQDATGGSTTTVTPSAGTGGSAGSAGAIAVGGPGRVVMHRLNAAEYDNTVRDLFGTEQRLSENFPPDDTAYGFDNIADALSITDVALGYYVDAAKRLSAEALSVGRRASLVPCDLASGKEACVTTVLTSFLPRAWRRPVQPAEIAQLTSLFSTNAADGASDDEALGRVLQAVLLAPDFLYRIEHNSGRAELRALDGYELATRLSYLTWSSMPDAALTDAAASGALATSAGLAAQVSRLLADQKARAFSDNFGSQWLMLRSLDNVHPDAKEYPAFDDSLRSAMRAETMRFFVDIVAGQRPLRELITSNSGYVNDRLARHYGMPAMASNEPVLTTLPATRGGLLRQASVLTVLSHAKESAPVLRGRWVLSQLLCKDLPPPPPDVPQEPAAQAGQSRRDRLAAHRVQPVCKTCHQFMDPLGLALEQYDGVGAYRTTDSGVAIDPSGVLTDGRSFSGPTELEAIIAADPALPHCMAQQLLTYALGRGPRASNAFDAAAVDAVAQSFAPAQLFPQLVSAIALSDAFRTREDQAAQ